MGTRTLDCRKFTANIFNKSKCSHCFRQRDEHSAAALECNRASRKVSKCGYLFVAPDWDFNNPLYRTKRWQRRWFVLYDDGEFTYSVDEHPETVPQAIIDMTKVLEVTRAENVTGHSNSIAITASDRVTFVKGACPEEAKWWLNILTAFPKTKGRHKRNATFPGGQATTIVQSGNPSKNRNRHHSYHKAMLSSSMVVGSGLDVISNNWNNEAITHQESGVLVNTCSRQDEYNKNAGNEITNRVYTDQPISTKSPPTRDKSYTDSKAQVRVRNRNRNNTTLSGFQEIESTSKCILIEDVRCDEKLKDIANTLSNLSQITSNQWTITNSATNAITNPTPTSSNNNTLTNHLPLEDITPTRDETDFPRELLNHQDFHKMINLRPKSLPLAPSTAPAIVSAIAKKIPSVAINDYNISSPKHHHKQNQAQERGDPDGGCNLDDLSVNYLSKTSELRVNLPAEDLLNSKKGWLMKQDIRTGEWSKHWFALHEAALFYYRDPVSEERGVLDGVLDMNSLANVSEVSVSRHYEFQLTTWDNRKIVLSTVSPNSRNNWIHVLRSAAGIQLQHESKGVDDLQKELIIKDNTSDDLKREIEKDFIKAQRNQELIINSIAINEPVPDTPPISTNVNTTTVPLAIKTVIFSSDEEYRTASEGGRRDSVDWGSPLSPSPPVTLTLFRARDRLRSRSSSSNRLYKRSRSSPPSSRRSTVDSVGSDDLPLIHPVQEEMNIDKDLQIQLGIAEKERDLLQEKAREREAQMSELLNALEQTELELTARIREVEEARDKLSKQLCESNSKAEKIVERLTVELNENKKKVKELEDRLSRGIEENDSLYKKLRHIEGGNSCSLNNLSRSRMKRVDSLSDLTNLKEIDPYSFDRDMLADEYNELKSRFEKAVNEIKAMKKELKESQYEYDSLEISYAALNQDFEKTENEDRSQLQMMAERIQDLTFKYTSSERQVRTFKQKLAKSDRRKSVSLKGKELPPVPKELEDKVSELENKIERLESSSSEKIDPSRSEDKNIKRTASYLRRDSLESSGSTESLQFMIRLGALEKRIENISPNTDENTMKNHTSPKVSKHLIERLKCLEGVLVNSKERIEQSLQQIQSLRSSRARRSVSPITDRNDSFSFIECSLIEVVKLMRESCESCESCIVGATSTGILLLPESNPIKLALIQLQAQLRIKLNDLLKQRRVLREHNELTARKDVELLAERIAFESVCFGKLTDSITRAENPLSFGEKQTHAEVAETSQLMSMLKAKLSGKCAFKLNGSLDILASVLARRLVLSSYNKGQNRSQTMSPINPKIIDELLRQQNEINLMAKRYKNNAMENLASGLATETLSYISSNDAVQGAVQEAWRQAQEAVNAELVQSEIAHVMMRNSERFENLIIPSFGYTLTTEEHISFENFADAVHDILRKEMENAIRQLTGCYEDCLDKMKRGQWRLHLEQERKASEGRQLLSEFADVVAHKALVDARIAVLKGDYISKELPVEERTVFSITNLQKYENLFDELANDLQICNPDDILAEADFNFLYKNFGTEFLSEKTQLKDVRKSLANLEESIGILNNILRSNNNNNSISTSVVEFETLKEISVKCRELSNEVDGITTSAQNLLKQCEHCEKMEHNICNLAFQHESELQGLQNGHDMDVTVLKKQLEDHVNTIKTLETDRNSLLEELTLQTNLVEIHEKELVAITLKLKNKEQEFHQKIEENIELIEQIQNRKELCKELKQETQKLCNKSLQQNAEYAALLHERDYIQSELNRERDCSRKLQRRLEMLELEHSKQLECLQEAYKDQILSHCSDFTGIADEESFRQRYQAEIEQLRTLCEKGLAAMESSHRRIISDIEERHRQEIERLLAEKEQALAEETQATLAALDAMRKAHQSEVQREVARFKQEFIRQFQKGDQSTGPIKEKEEELEELRQEILSFSEKYSIKCVENAALEERLRVANQKLKRFKQMQQFELRNKQFRAHLASEANSDLNFVQGLASKETSPSPDSEHALDEINMSTESSYIDPTPLTSTLATRTTDNTNNPLLAKHDSETEFHLRSECNEGVKLNTIYCNVTNTAVTTSTSIITATTKNVIKPLHEKHLNGDESFKMTTNNLQQQQSVRTGRKYIQFPMGDFSIDRQRTDRIVRSNQSEPVEQPKTLIVLSPKKYNMNTNNNKNSKLICLNSNNNNINISKSSKIQENNDPRENDHQNNNSENHLNCKHLIQKRLAVSISSLSELLNKNNNSIRKYKKDSISKIIIKNNNNNDHNTIINNGNTSNIINSKRIVIDHLKTGDAIEPSNSSSVNCRYDKNNCNIIKSQLESATSTSGTSSIGTTIKKCSPSPLSGRDVEHHHVTSHSRRFELEI